jgi:toxin ParE1/3/4
MAAIRRTPEAERDLLTIWLSIAQDSPRAADGVLDILDEKFRLLAGRPALGPLREDLAAGLRMFPAGRYLIFYRPAPDGIDVIRVLHSARDIPARFQES